ncbi:MAG: transglutaminaseTgpA domain-containing protein [Candidatus Sericytochromatia bacterium]
MFLKTKKFSQEEGHKVKSGYEVEDSIPFRIIVTITVLIGISSTILVVEDGLFLSLITMSLTVLGSYVSYVRRNAKNWWIKIILSLVMLITFVDFLRNVFLNPYDARIPLANLLIWLQVLHSFDLPRRKDMNYSLLVALILICVTATISRELYFGVFLISFIVCSLLSLLYNNLSQHNIYKLDIRPKTMFKIATPTIIVTILGMLAAFVLMPRYQTMKIKTLPLSIKLPEIPNFAGEVKNKNTKEVKQENINGKKVVTIKRTFNKDSYYGFSSELDLNFRGELSDEIVMKVRSSESNYWRGMAFDTYTGTNWKMSEPYSLNKVWANTPPMFVRMSNQIPKDLTKKRELVQTFYIEKEQSNLVFSAQYADEIYFPSNYLMIDKYGSLRSPVELNQGLVYSVVSRIPEYNMSILTTNYSGNIGHSAKITDNYLKLPPISDRVKKLAKEITKNAKNDFERMNLLSKYLKTNFPYDLNIKEFPENADTVDYFLFEQKKGYCEHFASALAVMGRSLGIPTRLATGFVSGKYNPITGYYEVKGSDAHAWVEAYYPFQGWFPFDPTPGYNGNFLQENKNDVFIFSSYLKELWNTIKELIPDSVFEFFENSLKVVLTFFIGIFTFVVKLFVNMNWVTFVALVMFSILSVLVSVGMSYLFGKIKFQKQKEKELINKYKNKEKIEIVKLQEEFISKIEKLGFKYQEGLTFKEYMQNISLNNNVLSSKSEIIVNELYDLRYGFEEIKNDDIKNIRNKTEQYLEEIKKSLVTK